jgi:chromosome segregation ATPase
MGAVSRPRSLTERVEALRREANACRSQAIRLNAKLSVLERECEELRGMREQVAESSARIDHAVDELVEEVTDAGEAPDANDEISSCDPPRRASPRP